MPTPNKSRYAVSAVLPVAFDRWNQNESSDLNYFISVLYRLLSLSVQRLVL